MMLKREHSKTLSGCSKWHSLPVPPSRHEGNQRHCLHFLWSWIDRRPIKKFLREDPMDSCRIFSGGVECIQNRVKM
ncbi:hypothetical protein CAEBREN_25600 [Caenorhabditis brenneri]|uniref:Uncharacterized protein n=1 Tax=Caenorhabditis brenneri TaxID=135651 RepID=G0P788_CAEBE|nr:hypothetical protein CAEBREN_25600 [Caenorhabditis brenneri]